MSTPSTKRWFRITTYSPIGEFEILSASSKFVTLSNGRREAKESSWHFLAETKAECKNWLVGHYEKQLSQAKLQMEGIEKKLAEAKAIEV